RVPAAFLQLSALRGVSERRVEVAELIDQAKLPCCAAVPYAPLPQLVGALAAYLARTGNESEEPLVPGIHRRLEDRGGFGSESPQQIGLAGKRSGLYAIRRDPHLAQQVFECRQHAVDADRAGQC